MKHILIIVFSSFFSFINGQDFSQFPKEIQSTFNYILKTEYLEQFDTISYQFRPRDWEIIDIDDDGVTEIFLWIYPHYNTTPTIIIYQYKDGRIINRVKEGLAPGPLIPRNDEFLSFHSIGGAVDFKLSDKKPGSDSLVALSSLKMKSHVVRYPNFIHFDDQVDNGGYVDITLTNTFDNEDNCANFQFSTPLDIISGVIDEQKYFVTLVKTNLYLYRIETINENGLLDKEIIVKDLPKDFKKLENRNGMIGFLDENDKFQKL